MSQPDTFVIVDGNSLMHRAFHALPLRFPTRTACSPNAVFELLSMLFKVIGDEQPLSWRWRSIFTGDSSATRTTASTRRGRKPTAPGVEASVRPRARVSDENGGQNP